MKLKFCLHGMDFNSFYVEHDVECWQIIGNSHLLFSTKGIFMHSTLWHIYKYTRLI